MRFLTDLQMPLPKTFCASAEFALNHHLREAFLSDEPSLQKVAPLIEEAAAVNVGLDVPALEYALRSRLEQMADQLSASQADPMFLRRFRAAVELARSLPFPVDLWQVQNLFHEQLRVLAPSSHAGTQPAPEPLVARELVEVGETLLFTPQALDVPGHPASSD